MYTYDEILASGYYVFREDLNTMVIGSILNLLGGKTCLHSLKYSDNQVDNRIKIEELSRIIEFDDGIFKLKEGIKVEDIKDFIKEDLVIVFQQIKNMMNSDYSSKQYKKVK